MRPMGSVVRPSGGREGDRMLSDALSQFSTNQAITTASVISTNHMPISSIVRDLAIGKCPIIDIVVTQSFAIAASTPALTCVAVLDLADPLWGAATGSGISCVLGISQSFVTAQLVAGNHIYIALSPLGTYQVSQLKTAAAVAPLSELGIYYSLAGGTFNAGTFSASLVDQPKSWVQSADYLDAVP